ncbi:SCO family protein [Polluticaenibacter yanchengensis]|uniref:SCO family protein n=1 Tax=Polluticaenibacter yanchengensis TaxID=3014562 RepID=A0ABT4UP07_9BACT|nr:SCO family protein [Chitinophagaceae bacterium LY-5]
MMKKSAALGLTIALFIPVICYFFVKMTGEGAVNMPKKFFADSTSTRVVDGKTVYDTAWHKIPDFVLTNQLGRKVSPENYKGKILVVNTFFTRCPNICPALTRNVRTVQASFENPKRKQYGDTSIVQFLSLSVDPERDSVEALKKWADRFYVNNDNWDLLTGQKKEIYDLLLNDFKLGAQDGKDVDSNFIHSEKVILVDRDRIVRGFYNGLDSAQMGTLAEDIGKLFLERDRNKPSFFRQYIPLIPTLILIPIVIFIFGFVLKRKGTKLPE